MPALTHTRGPCTLFQASNQPDPWWSAAKYMFPPRSPPGFSESLPPTPTLAARVCWRPWEWSPRVHPRGREDKSSTAQAHPCPGKVRPLLWAHKPLWLWGTGWGEPWNALQVPAWGALSPCAGPGCSWDAAGSSESRRGYAGADPPPPLLLLLPQRLRLLGNEAVEGGRCQAAGTFQKAGQAKGSPRRTRPRGLGPCIAPGKAEPGPLTFPDR